SQPTHAGYTKPAHDQTVVAGFTSCSLQSRWPGDGRRQKAGWLWDLPPTPYGVDSSVMDWRSTHPRREPHMARWFYVAQMPSLVKSLFFARWLQSLHRADRGDTDDDKT